MQMQRVVDSWDSCRGQGRRHLSRRRRRRLRRRGARPGRVDSLRAMSVPTRTDRCIAFACKQMEPACARRSSRWRFSGRDRAARADGVARVPGPRSRTDAHTYVSNSCGSSSLDLHDRRTAGADVDMSHVQLTKPQLISANRLSSFFYLGLI